MKWLVLVCAVVMLLRSVSGKLLQLACSPPSDDQDRECVLVKDSIVVRSVRCCCCD